MMSRIKGKSTKPELMVRRMAHALGYRFRLHRRGLPGSPDLVFPRLRLAIFVHGCFWHRHANCRYAYTPKSNVDFWNRKFESNTIRDKKVTGELQSGGWRVAIIWECETADAAALRKTLGALLDS